MKKLAIATAAAAVLMTAPAVAGNAPVLDNEPTASIGAGVAFGGQVFREHVFDGGRDYTQRFTLNTDGTKNILTRSLKSSDNR